MDERGGDTDKSSCFAWCTAGNGSVVSVLRVAFWIEDTREHLCDSDERREGDHDRNAANALPTNRLFIRLTVPLHFGNLGQT